MTLDTIVLGKNFVSQIIVNLVVDTCVYQSLYRFYLVDMNGWSRYVDIVTEIICAYLVAGVTYIYHMFYKEQVS